MGLEFQSPGIDSCGIVTSTQLRQRTVDGADGFCTIHGRAFYHDLRSREGHDTCQPGIPNRRGVTDHAKVMCDDLVDLDPSACEPDPLRHRPVNPVLRLDLIHLLLIEIQRI